MSDKLLVVWPAQCPCGHLYLERYMFRTPNENGEVGFVWCGFCRTRRNVKPLALPDDAPLFPKGE